MVETNHTLPRKSALQMPGQWVAFEGMTDKQIEESVIDIMMSDLAEATEPFRDLKTKMPNANNKWRVVSGMQKAIRQSDQHQAVRLATALHNSTERETLWRRIGVTSLEDIGIANLPLAALTFAVAGKAKWREAHGGLRIPQYIAASMAATAKDRSACNLACLIAAEGGVQEVIDTKAHLMEYSALTTTGRAAVLRFAAYGVEDEKIKYKKVIEPMPELEQAIVASLPRLMQYVYKKGKQAGAESLQCAAAALTPKVIATDPKLFEWRTCKPVEHTIIKGVPSYAYDKHTHEGKRAIAIFLKKCEPLRKFMAAHYGEDTKYADIMRCLGSAVFYAEGGEYLVDRLWWPEAESIAQRELSAFALRYKLLPSEFAHLHQLVGDNLGTLNHARALVMAD